MADTCMNHHLIPFLLLCTMTEQYFYIFYFCCRYMELFDGKLPDFVIFSSSAIMFCNMMKPVQKSEKVSLSLRNTVFFPSIFIKKDEKSQREPIGKSLIKKPEKGSFFSYFGWFPWRRNALIVKKLCFGKQWLAYIHIFIQWRLYNK